MYLVLIPGTKRVQLSSTAPNRELKVTDGVKTRIKTALASGKRIAQEGEKFKVIPSTPDKLCATGCIIKARMLRGQAVRTNSLTRNKSINTAYQTYIAALDTLINNLEKQPTTEWVFPTPPWENISG